MIRAYDDNGNVVDLVEWESRIRVEVIGECMKAIINTGSKVFNSYAGKEWKDLDVLTLLADRQYEILRILEELKEGE